tara:strand:+ start:189 stop:581 length:393 start_codon:yes stop_codon:yes gene_type:complete
MTPNKMQEWLKSSSEDSKVNYNGERFFEASQPIVIVDCDRCAHMPEDRRGFLPLPNIVLSQESMEDPEFMEGYKNGVYDDLCPDCMGCAKQAYPFLDGWSEFAKEEWLGYEEWKREERMYDRLHSLGYEI